MRINRVGSIIQQATLYSVYFAPRGRNRLLVLGEQIAQRHLNYDDRLIGIIGDAGSGKSCIIMGMFPGLDLVNHDDGLSINKIMEMRMTFKESSYDSTTYHLDMRFQMAFTQMFEIVQFVKGALERGRRVVIEHFDLLYPYLNINAEMIIGVGDEIIVTRPTPFGPLPKDIHDIVFDSLKYRKMAHTAEDITIRIMEKYFDFNGKVYSGDIRRGFVLNFQHKPDIDLEALEKRVQGVIDMNLDVSYYDEDHIIIEDELVECNGPRIHVSTTGQIQKFSLLKEIFYDEINDVYSIIGIIGDRNLQDLNALQFI